MASNGRAAASALDALALARAPALSTREKALLLDSAGPDGLRTMGKADAEALIARPYRGSSWDPGAWYEAARGDLDWLRSPGAGYVDWTDAGYPALLRETARPPFLLFVRGRLPDPWTPSVAMVGTRFPTGRGMDAARALARQAAEAGVAVVSGLARGIDAAAHRGALAGGGPTFAVLGRGIDEVYPPRNRELAAAIIASGGGLLSEYPPGTVPTRWTFPERNRIIAGLCRSTVVVEAPSGSGALITASFALEEGRDVYVAAACSGGPRSAGSDALAADGARALGDFRDLLYDWDPRADARA